MPASIPVGGLTVASVALTAVVIGNAYYQKKQFYPSVVYITKSNPSMAAIYVLTFTLVVLLGKLLKKLFFGQLRAAEFEHLIERSFYAITETCLAFTVFRDDFSPKFVALFTVLLFLKAFHWLADYRVDFMERSPVITIIFHLRASSLLMLLGLFDFLLVEHAYHSTVSKGASVQLVFGFEYAILLTIAINIAVKYVCHTIDLTSANPWETKAVYLLYTELALGFVKVVLYVIFMYIMIRIHTFPLFIIRPMYLTLRSFKKALNDVIQSRRAIHNMNTLYPDATAEELSAVDNVCIICREEMVSGAKKLPCGHIFHSSCLRSWFQRQQTCPTCRMDILRQPPPPPPQTIPRPTEQPTVPPPQQTPAADNTPQHNIAAGAPPGVVIPPGMYLPFPAPGNLSNVSSTACSITLASSTVTTTTTTTGSVGAGTTTTSSNSALAGDASSLPASPPFGLMPPFFPFMPFSIPPPVMPPNFSGLTDEELKRMEGKERSNVEARIQALRNIQTLLDAAVVQMSQYASIMASLELPSSLQKERTDCHSNEKNSDVPQKSELASTSKEELIQTASSDNNDIPDSFEAEISNSEANHDNPQEIRRKRIEKFSTNGAIGSL